MVNKPLIRPYLGYMAIIMGGWLTSHEALLFCTMFGSHVFLVRMFLLTNQLNLKSWAKRPAKVRPAVSNGQTGGWFTPHPWKIHMLKLKKSTPKFTPPETKIFAPENGWLEDFFVSFWVSAYFQGLSLAVSFRECKDSQKLTSKLPNLPWVHGRLKISLAFVLFSDSKWWGPNKLVAKDAIAFFSPKWAQLFWAANNAPCDPGKSHHLPFRGWLSATT